MPRTMTAPMLAEAAAALKRPVWFAELEFTSGFLRLWTGFQPVTWNGQTWTPVGGLGAISTIKSTDDLRADNVQFRLSGINSESLALVLGSVRQGKSAKAWLGFLDGAGAIIADPVLLFSGLMDVPGIEEGAETSSIGINAENRLARLRKSCPRRFTDEDQKIDYPTDRGFEFVLALASGDNRLGGIPNNVSNPGAHKPRVA